MIICETDPVLARELEAMLTRAGHEVSGLFIRPPDALARSRYMPPQAVVLGGALVDAAGGQGLLNEFLSLGINVWIVDESDEEAQHDQQERTANTLGAAARHAKVPGQVGNDHPLNVRLTILP